LSEIRWHHVSAKFVILKYHSHLILHCSNLTWK